MGLQRFPWKDYRGGINLRDGPINLAPNEFQAAKNVSLTLRGAQQQRAGKTRFDVSGFPSAVRAEHLRSWYFGATRLLMASIDGDIYSFTTGGAGTLRFNGTAGTTWCFESALDDTGAQTIWALNGVDAAKRWNGTDALVSAWANAPPNGTMLRLWRNKMCIAGVAATPQRLFFSDIGDPDGPVTTYGTNWVDIKSTEDDLDPITWLGVLGDYLVVFKKRSTWIVYNPTSFENRRIDNVGCEDRFQSCEMGGRVYFFNRTGIYSTDGDQVTLESDLISPFFGAVANEVGVLDVGQVSKARMMATRDRRVLFACSISGGTNNRLWEYIPELQTDRGDGEITAPWMVHDYAVSSMCTFRPVNQDVIIAGAADTNKFHTIFDELALNDDGVAISAYTISPWISVIAEEPYERVRRVNVEHEGRVVMQLMRDLNNDVVAYSKVMEAEVDPDPLWDGGTWDSGIWDPINATKLSRARPEKRARYHAIKLMNDVLNKSFAIYAVELVVRGGKEH